MNLRVIRKVTVEPGTKWVFTNIRVCVLSRAEIRLFLGMICCRLCYETIDAESILVDLDGNGYHLVCLFGAYVLELDTLPPVSRLRPKGSPY